MSLVTPSVRLRVLPSLLPRDIEIRVAAGIIQKRYAGEGQWTDIVAVTDLTGPRGPAVEMRLREDMLEYRSASSSEPWLPLLPISMITPTIPSFSGGETTTLEPGEDATVVLLENEDGNYVFHFAVPAGRQGETGEQGERGLQGEQGFQGETGEKGDTGDKGDRGEKGDKGDQGDIGPKGDQGDIGPKGDQGDIGPKGDQGDQGDTGPKGDKGDQGEQGPEGPQGEKGDPGDRGPEGPVGPMGRGLNVVGSLSDPSELPPAGELNDAYLVGPNLYVWEGSQWVNVGRIQGADGPEGPQGPKGDKGDRGDQGGQGERGPEGPSPDVSTFQLRSEKGQAGGYAGLDADGMVPEAQMRVGSMAYRNLTISASDPTGGADGDVWFKV